MYEYKQGTARIVNALDDIRADAASLQRLAQLLHYLPEQLEEDLTALNDFWQNNRENPN